MSRYAGVAPLGFFHSFAMLFAASSNFSYSLADIFFSAGACKHVYAFLLVRIPLSLAVRAENAS